MAGEWIFYISVYWEFVTLGPNQLVDQEIKSGEEGVESIEVLKGSSAAIYGTRAYGGVILIKTKMK